MTEISLVTGGGGFVGKALCLELLKRGHKVRSLARGEYPELQSLGVETVRADLSADPNTFAQAFHGVGTVFHTASKVDMWGRYQDFFKANVIGTRNVIELCRKYSVANLIYTSSPSVIADGKNHKNIDESYPYPKKHMAFYPATKAIAEREVLGAADHKLKTVALRPHLIWGPGDRHLIPTIVGKAKSGKLMIVGDGNNMVDLCFIEECVAAHLTAHDRLKAGADISGKAYFISQGSPLKMWDWINQVLELSGLPPIKKKVSASLAYGIAAILEQMCKLIPGRPEPRLTRFLVSQMSTDHYFSIERAKRELGYSPKNTVQQGMSKTFKINL